MNNVSTYEIVIRTLTYMSEEDLSSLREIAYLLQGNGGRGWSNTGVFSHSLTEFIANWSAPFGSANSYIRKITEYEGEAVIPETTGKEFPGKSWDDDIPGEPQPFYAHLVEQPKPATPALVEKIREEAPFYQVFAGFHRNLEELVLTRGQILRFCEENIARFKAGEKFIFLWGKDLLTPVSVDWGNFCYRRKPKGGKGLSVFEWHFNLTTCNGPADLVGSFVVVPKSLD